MAEHETDGHEERSITFLEPAKKASFWQRLWGNFLAGFVVFAPISITIYLIWTFINFVDARVLPLIPDIYNPERYLPISLPGLGLVFFFFVVAGLGAFTKNLFGRQLFRIGERIVDRMPVVRSLYNALKQIVETIFARSGEDNFEKVCLIEYPRRGLWAVAFVTTETAGEIRARSANGKSMISVFLPTTPNPTSGFLLFVPREDATLLDMSVEDAAKLVISAGLVVPEWEDTGEGDSSPLLLTDPAAEPRSATPRVRSRRHP